MTKVCTCLTSQCPRLERAACHSKVNIIDSQAGLRRELREASPCPWLPRSVSCRSCSDNAILVIHCRGMIEVISKLQEAVSKAAAEAEKEEVVAAEAVDTVLAADSGALAEAEVEAAVRENGPGLSACTIIIMSCILILP